MTIEELVQLNSGLDRVLSAPVLVEMKARIEELERENARLLAVAGQFQAGDTRSIESARMWLVSAMGIMVANGVMRHSPRQLNELEKILDLLNRMLAAARIMEGEQE